MSAGSYLLALTGPVGIGIGVVGIMSGGLIYRSKNKKIFDATQKDIKQCYKDLSNLNSIEKKLKEMISLTEKHQKLIKELLDFALNNFPNDYKKFSDKEKEQLGSLINHTNSLSKLIKKEI